MRENVKELIAVQAAHTCLLKVMFTTLLGALPAEVRAEALRQMYTELKVTVTVGSSSDLTRQDAEDVQRVCRDFIDGFTDSIIKLLPPDAPSPRG